MSIIRFLIGRASNREERTVFRRLVFPKKRHYEANEPYSRKHAISKAFKDIEIIYYASLERLLVSLSFLRRKVRRDRDEKKKTRKKERLGYIGSIMDDHLTG